MIGCKLGSVYYIIRVNEEPETGTGGIRSSLLKVTRTDRPSGPDSDRSIARHLPGLPAERAQFLAQRFELCGGTEVDVISHHCGEWTEGKVLDVLFRPDGRFEAQEVDPSLTIPC